MKSLVTWRSVKCTSSIHNSNKSFFSTANTLPPAAATDLRVQWTEIHSLQHAAMSRSACSLLQAENERGILSTSRILHTRDTITAIELHWS